MPSRPQLPLHRSSFVPLVALGTLPFVLFFPLTAVRRVLSAQDIQAYFFPYHVLPARMLAEGHLPLWNPYAFGGIPLLADGQTAMFYPPNWLFFVLPGPAALNYVLLLQFSIAGIGTYLFARSLGLWRLPAVISALAYMFCGFLTARVVHLSIMSGAALIPVIFFCLERLLTGGAGADRVSTARWFTATALALAFQAMAGHPQVPVYTALATALYTIVRGIERSIGTGRPQLLARAALLLSGAYLLGCAIAAIQLVPWAEFAAFSVRAAGAHFEFVFRTSTTGAEWLLFLFPYLLGAHSTSIFAVGPMTIEQAVRAWEHAAYVGILPLGLAAVALGHFGGLTVGSPRGERTVVAPGQSSLLRHRWYSLLFLVVLLVTGVLLAAGWHTPLSQVVHRIPVLGSLRAVERGLVLGSFALTILAGFGLQAVLERQTRQPWLLVPGLLILAAPAFFVWQASQPDAQPLFGMAPRDLEKLSLRLPNTYVPLLLAFSSGLLLVWWSSGRIGTRSQALAVALVLVDLGIYTTSFTPTVNRRLYEYRPQVLHAFARDGEPFRKATMIIETNDLVGRSAQEMLAMSWGMVHGVEDINGFNSLQPRRYTDYLFGPGRNDVSYGYLVDTALLRPESPILSTLNVRYVLVPRGAQVEPGPHLRPVFTNASVRVYENTAVHPRAYFVDRVRSEMDPRAVLDRVTAPGFDGRREALVESAEPPSLPTPTAAAAARVWRISPTEVRVSTTTAEPRFLVVNEMHFPGWRAYVDGVETPIYRTNYLFRGLVVPAGRHVVTFVYRPGSVISGAIVSAVALLLAGALLVSVQRSTMRVS